MWKQAGSLPTLHIGHKFDKDFQPGGALQLSILPPVPHIHSCLIGLGNAWTMLFLS